MTTLTAEQAQQIEEALDTLNSVYGLHETPCVAKALATIRAVRPLYAAPQPVSQEPVAVISESAIGLVKLHSNGVSLPFDTPLYTHPVRTKDLTDEEQLELARSSVGKSRHWLVAAVIAADREKNK